MLKSSDLRIGNITSAGIVIEIQKECFYVHDGENSLKNTWFEVEPVNITEALLLRLGFEKVGRNFTTKENFIIYFSLSTENYAFRQNFGAITELNYIHELQNLYFALTKNELTLKNIEL